MMMVPDILKHDKIRGRQFALASPTSSSVPHDLYVRGAKAYCFSINIPLQRWMPQVCWTGGRRRSRARPYSRTVTRPITAEPLPSFVIIQFQNGPRASVTACSIITPTRSINGPDRCTPSRHIDTGTMQLRCVLSFGPIVHEPDQILVPPGGANSTNVFLKVQRP